MDEDLKKLAPILESLQRLVHDSTTYQKSLEEVDEQFTQLLSEETARHASSGAGLLGRVRQMGQAVLRVIHPPRTSEALLEQIRQTCELTDRQFRLLKDTGLIGIDEMGNPRIRNGPEVILTNEKAALYLFLTGCLFGMSIWSILIESAPGIWLLFRGLGLGIGIGSIAGFVLGRSYRAYPILEKLASLQPWLSSQQVLRKA